MKEVNLKENERKKKTTKKRKKERKKEKDHTEKKERKRLQRKERKKKDYKEMKKGIIIERAVNFRKKLGKLKESITFSYERLPTLTLPKKRYNCNKFDKRNRTKQ